MRSGPYWGENLARRYPPSPKKHDEEKVDSETIRVELSSSNKSDAEESSAESRRGEEKRRKEKRRKETRRSRSAPNHRRKKKTSTHQQRDHSSRSDQTSVPEPRDGRWTTRVRTGEGSSEGVETQSWANAWESAEEWNRWHMDWAAAWMHQTFVHPKNLPMVAPPIPKYGEKGGKRKGEKQGKGQEQKAKRDGNLMDNVRLA